MTAPDLSFIIPLKYKTYVSLIGSALSFVVPFVLEVTDSLPAPWPALVGCVLLVLSALGVYKAPYAPKGTTLAVDPAEKDVTPLPQGTPVAVAVEQTVDYRNPWK